jgi:hypothetical protein
MTKQDLHRLVDSLPEESVEAAAALLAHAGDPELAAMYALPHDDEPYTEEQRAEDAEAMREPAIPWERAKAELKAD